jgi:hypothetical protein
MRQAVQMYERYRLRLVFVEHEAGCLVALILTEALSLVCISHASFVAQRVGGRDASRLPSGE